MIKFLILPFFILIFINSKSFAAKYKYLCKGDCSKIILQFDESR